MVLSILRLILFVIVFSWILKIVRRLIAFFFYKKNFNQNNNNPHNRAPQQERKVPETQEDRILEFQRKNFESTEVEDADFEEVK